MNKYYIKFEPNKNVTCDFICGIVQKIVNSNKNIENKVLVLELRDITDNKGDSLLPKITFKN
jgi:hypothetical protein